MTFTAPPPPVDSYAWQPEPSPSPLGVLETIRASWWQSIVLNLLGFALAGVCLIGSLVVAARSAEGGGFEARVSAAFIGTFVGFALGYVAFSIFASAAFILALRASMRRPVGIGEAVTGGLRFVAHLLTSIPLWIAFVVMYTVAFWINQYLGYVVYLVGGLAMIPVVIACSAVGLRKSLD
jgi:hypothetical protein